MKAGRRRSTGKGAADEALARSMTFSQDDSGLVPPRNHEPSAARRSFSQVAVLGAAFALSVSVLPFVWVRSLGDAATFGAPGPRTFGLLLLSIGFIASSGWYLRRLDAHGPGVGRRFGVLLVMGWGLAVAVSVSIEWLVWGPRFIALPLIALASLHVLWLAWMTWLPIAAPTRCGVLLMLLACALPFYLLFAFAGYAGAGRIAIRWRGGRMSGAMSGDSLVDAESVAVAPRTSKAERLRSIHGARPHGRVSRCAFGGLG